jgi:glycosyltransferase EpsE
MLFVRKYKVSVIMGIYNCASTLNESIDSLLEQSFQDFNVIMCDDGSVDDTYNIAKKYVESMPDRFLLLKNIRNMGLSYSLNKCLGHSTGDYIARMDGDDISLPERFEREVEFLDNNPDFCIVSSLMIHFDENGDWGIGKMPIYPKKNDFVKSTPFAHAPCMVRREAYLSVGGYSLDKKLIRVEDYHLWIKMYNLGCKGYNIQMPLYKMRDDKNAIKRRNFSSRINETYVKYIAIRLFKLPFYYFIFLLKPIILVILPTRLYRLLHRLKLNS